MKYICINCNEEFDINKSHLTKCPYCNCETIEKDKYEKIQDELNNSKYTEEDIEKILKEEVKVYEKIKGTPLERVLEDIKAMYELIKDPKAALKAKVISIITILYIINPMDVIADAIPAFGLIDDAGLVMIAVNNINDALSKYKNIFKEKISINKSDTTIVYQLKQNLEEDRTRGKYKKNLLIWEIPVNKKNNLYASLINDKIINGNETYLLNNYVNTCLVPINNFDQYISDSIFNEAIIIFKALGVKKITYTKKMISTSNKKIATGLKSKKRFC